MKKFLFFLFLFFYNFIKSQEPNIALITIDTWRADYLSIYGSGKVKTPNLDYYAKNGIYLKEVETPCPATTPAHASILTGLYPKNHGIRDNHHFKLKKEVKTIGELLKEKGYYNIAVVSASPLRKVYGLNKGFEIYDDEGLGVQGDESLVPSYRKGEKSVERALKYVSDNKLKKIFLWLHIYEPHVPYEPPLEFYKEYENDPYGGEVAYSDRMIGDFIKKLIGLKDERWFIVITSDHGEGLNDNLEKTHGILLFKETRLVPLIIYDTKMKLEKKVEGVRSLIDVAPTIAEIANINYIFDGVSLFKKVERRVLFSETLLPLMNFGVNGAYSLRSDNKIFIRNGSSDEVYINGDEKDNRISSEKEFAQFARDEVSKFYKNDNIEQNLNLNNEELKSLKALGYIGGTTRADGLLRCDLKRFVRDFNDLERGRLLLQEKRFLEAYKYYDDFLKKYPKAVSLYVDLATIFVNLNKIREAKEILLRAISVDQKNSTAYLNLGNIYIMEKDYKRAEESFHKCLELEEESEAYLNLGLIYYYYLNQNEMAKKYLKRFIELVPLDPEREKIEKLIKEIELKKD